MKRPLPLAILSAAGLAPTQTLGDAAANGPPSAGTAGRMELLHHWGRLPPALRRELLMVARRLGAPEEGRAPT